MRKYSLKQRKRSELFHQEDMAIASGAACLHRPHRIAASRHRRVADDWNPLA
jgi:hypothetical protein